MRGSTGMIEARASATEAVAIAELPAVGNVRVIAVNQAVFVPIRSPAVPPPAEATEQTDTNSHAEPDSRPIEEEVRIPNPTRIEGEGITVDDPGIVFRHITPLAAPALQLTAAALERAAAQPEPAAVYRLG